MDINKFLGKRPRDEHFEKMGICVKTVRSRQEVDEEAMHLIRAAHQLPEDQVRAEVVRVQEWAAAKKSELTAKEAEERCKQQNG